MKEQGGGGSGQQQINPQGAPYHVQILEIFRYTTGPRVRISVLDRQFQQSTEILTALQWWEGAGLQVPSLLWQDGGEGWTLFVGERCGFVKTMGEAARLIWG